MALKRLLTRIFNSLKPKKSGPHLTQDVAPVPKVLSQVPSLNVTQPVAPLPERSPATETTIPLDLTLRLNIVLSPTGDGWHPCASLRQGQPFPTPGTPCDGSTGNGPPPLLENPLSNSSVEFTTAAQPANTIDTIPSSVQRLGLSRPSITASQGM